jgi:hypothetical protein
VAAQRRCTDLASSFSGIADFFYIGQVAQSSRSQLRCDQIFSGNKERREAGRFVDFPFHAPRPRFIEVHAIDSGKNINCYGRTSESDEFLRICEIIGGDALKRRAEAGECRIGCFGILRIGFDEEV